MPSDSEALAPFLSRRSVPSRQLGAPGPDDAQLAAMLQSAVRVPDHGKLTPWRFLRIQGNARLVLGDLLAERSRQRDANVADAVVEKERARFARAPLVIAVVACLARGHKVPEIEQMLSGGAVCFSLLQTAQALGFGAQWLTGWAAYDPVIQQQLGLVEHERILGFIHVGTAKEAAPERARPDAWSLLSDWSPRSP